jgi:hypothetical protein
LASNGSRTSLPARSSSAASHEGVVTFASAGGTRRQQGANAPRSPVSSGTRRIGAAGAVAFVRRVLRGPRMFADCNGFAAVLTVVPGGDRGIATFPSSHPASRRYGFPRDRSKWPDFGRTNPPVGRAACARRRFFGQWPSARKGCDCTGGAELPHAGWSLGAGESERATARDRVTGQPDDTSERGTR